jgi:hypothetical protein
VINYVPRVAEGSKMKKMVVLVLEFLDSFPWLNQIARVTHTH